MTPYRERREAGEYEDKPTTKTSTTTAPKTTTKRATKRSSTKTKR